jgi:hypothetical protein
MRRSLLVNEAERDLDKAVFLASNQKEDGKLSKVIKVSETKEKTTCLVFGICLILALINRLWWKDCLFRACFACIARTVFLHY